MNLTDRVFQLIEASPRSGGAMIEQLPLERDAVLVYGALADLERDGRIVAHPPTSGERLWALPDALRPVGKPAGMPAAFQMGDEQMAWIESELWSLTEGLPSHYFEELRRAVVARADRLVHEGSAVEAAARTAVESLGEPRSARKVLQAIEGGKKPPTRLRRSAGKGHRKLLVGLLLLIGVPFLLRAFVVGWYRLPELQVSMAPALVPGVEGGDDIVVADLISYRFREPRRWEMALFEHREQGASLTYIKRVVGLPGEEILVRDGDLLLLTGNGGERVQTRLVKERALLDRLAVPLWGADGFEWNDQLPGYVLREVPHTGFRLPDGTMEKRESPAGDVILEASIRVAKLTDSIVILIREGRDSRDQVYQIVFTASGYESGVVVEGKAVVRGKPCQLLPNRTYELWITNADRVLRVELDGEEIARWPIRGRPGPIDIEIPVNGDGARIEGLRLSRDLVYTDPPGTPRSVTLGADQFYLLGDNSPISKDSRQLGPIARSSLLGRALWVAWPPDRARSLAPVK